MTASSLPIFIVVDDGADVLSTATVEAAVGWIEVPEVQAGAYAVLDAEGREATLAVDRWDVRVAGWSQPNAARLRSILVRFLADHGVEVKADMSHAEVVSLARRLASDIEYARMWPRWLGRFLRRRRRQRNGQSR